MAGRQAKGHRGSAWRGDGGGGVMLAGVVTGGSVCSWNFPGDQACDSLAVMGIVSSCHGRGRGGG